MLEQHLTVDDVERYVETELDAPVRAEMEQHLASCVMCRARVAHNRRVDAALRTLPRAKPPRDLAVRINAAVELRVTEERVRRGRVPLIAAATFFSFLLSLWFGFEMLVAFQENGALDLFSLFTSRPDVFSAYSTDAFFAIVEALPYGEIALTLFALFTVVVLAQQWAEAVQPRASF
jgi:anti-sigma factor RsiW